MHLNVYTTFKVLWLEAIIIILLLMVLCSYTYSDCAVAPACTLKCCISKKKLDLVLAETVL